MLHFLLYLLFTLIKKQQSNVYQNTYISFREVCCVFREEITGAIERNPSYRTLRWRLIFGITFSWWCNYNHWINNIEYFFKKNTHNMCDKSDLQWCVLNLFIQTIWYTRQNLILKLSMQQKGLPKNSVGALNNIKQLTEIA